MRTSKWSKDISLSAAVCVEQLFLHSWRPELCVCVCVHVPVPRSVLQHPDPQDEDGLRLECSVWRPAELGPCTPHSLRWLNETGAELSGLGGGQQGGGQQADCSTFLAVRQQPGFSSRYRCQLLDEQMVVQVEQEFSPDIGESSSGVHTLTLHL